MNWFVCDNCNTVDELEIAGYERNNPVIEYRCTHCKYGEWHNRFPMEQYDPRIHFTVINRPTGLGLG